MNIDPKEIGIGILDLYTEEDLQNCWDSIPTKYKNHDDLLTRVYIVSNNNNKYLSEGQQKKYTTPVQLATMRNYLISQMRMRDCKYYFILHSNQIIKDPNIFENTIKLAQTFGTWVIFGPSTDNIPLEDDENNLTLNLSKNLNTEFMFLFSGVFNNAGYFDERFFNGKDIDVLDYVLKLRKKEVYPPTGYHPTIQNDWLDSGVGVFNKMGFLDIPNQDKSVQLAYSLFFLNNKYIPTQNEPAAVSNDELLNKMEQLQKNYGKK
jgi:hypothetical protein